MGSPKMGLSKGDLKLKRIARAVAGKPKPNRQSIGIHPRNVPQKTKAEMQADLKKAVENTK